MAPRKRWIGLGVLLVVLAALAVGAWANRGQIAYAQIATAYAAKQTCSCLHVSGRSLESCIAGFPADAREAVTVTQNGETVRASVLFGAISAEAAADGEYGCRLTE
ncbi:MAG TPA: hypothetical protein VEA80_09160 [Vitreimonas sp.]|uniref:hypothetical protein n=1 Tax=Vitreimonas sp. TaxID=3069702 RepID=UPI002D58A3FD|nr:hypothetical protein [Vitreimonas sp.]HYD87630.1 hypothetical protein [Vitreimonas sp.]